MIKIEGLSHSFGKNVVLEDVMMEAKDASVLGLVGINGAGKSTLLRLISGIYVPQKGTVTYDGESPLDAYTRKDIFLLPDDPYYTNSTTCDELFSMYSNFYPDMDRSVFDEITDHFKLPKKKAIKSFSKGMRRQVFVALAFAVAPRYLLLDEAFDGLDPLARKMFKDHLKKLVKEKGSTVIISSHALKELEDFCDAYVMIDNNHIISSGSMLEKKMDLCKFQMAFTNPVHEVQFATLPVKSLKIIGRFVTVVLEGDEYEIKQKLEALKPAVMDRLEVNFEEVFIEDIDKRIRGEEKNA
ncbi:MAG: ABC transporter ATP-binding protein [Saccharofermentans sp.]|nr:ABC transporter ATP-binding protein [Saccharofermentans sp.]